MVLALLGLAGPGWAQDACMLIPTPLAKRVATASLIVEAGVRAQQVVSENGHIYTISELTVYKVFQGTEPVVLRLVEAGGTVGLRREVVSTSITMAPGQQGLFLLEPHPLLPGTYRLVAGPQGFVRYDLADRTASEPFGRYASIEGTLYPAVETLVGAAWRNLRPNAALAGALPVARPTAQPVISSFSPTSLTAGTNAVLTINGSNFGATQGSGSVEFPNANSGGSSFVSANPADYVSLQWSDNQIQVRVPSTNVATGGVAGTGTFRVINSGGETGTSPTALTVVYALSNLGQGANNPPIRPKLINDDTQGGYTLLYTPSFQSNIPAREAFERANTQWACKTGVNRTTSTTNVNTGAMADNFNLVAFDNTTTPTLPAGVLGVAYSYYRICDTNATLSEIDVIFANRNDWNFGPQAPAFSQFDFESVAVHELGHATQLGHVINTAAVMHFSIANGQNKRTLGTSDDLTGGRDEVAFSTTSNTAACGTPPGPHMRLVLAGCAPLPVELVAFKARYQAERGTLLAWATASERNSAYFAVESQEEGTPQWKEVERQLAAGSSSSPRTYAARDPRLLSGTRYYRLRQVDHDGSTSYSSLITVSGLESGLALYPNPVADRLQVSGPAQAGRLTFYDVMGNKVTGFELVAGPNDVDVSALRPGFYLVEWADGRTVRRGRLQKL